MSKNEIPSLKQDKFTGKQVNQWVLEKLEDNPLKFGSDIGNPAIMQCYLMEIHDIHLPLEVLSTCASVSRKKNDILVNRPELDFRDTYAINRDKDKTKVTKPFSIFLIDVDKEDEE